MLGALRKERQVAVRQVYEPCPHVLAGQLDEVGPDPVAHAPAAGVQHHPHPVVLVEAGLDEVIAAAQRAELGTNAFLQRASGLAGSNLRMFLVGPSQEPGAACIAPAHAPIAVLVGSEAHRHRVLDRGADRVERVGQFRRCEPVEAHRRHAAPDIDPDGRRDHRAIRRDHAAHGGADPDMDVV